MGRAIWALDMNYVTIRQTPGLTPVGWFGHFVPRREFVESETEEPKKYQKPDRNYREPPQNEDGQTS